jgi:hypothetical protein
MELFVKCFLILTRTLLNPIIVFFMRLYYRKIDKNNVLPPIKHQLLLLPAHKLASKIRNKEV